MGRTVAWPWAPVLTVICCIVYVWSCQGPCMRQYYSVFLSQLMRPYSREGSYRRYPSSYATGGSGHCALASVWPLRGSSRARFPLRAFSPTQRFVHTTTLQCRVKCAFPRLRLHPQGTQPTKGSSEPKATPLVLIAFLLVQRRKGASPLRFSLRRALRKRRLCTARIETGGGLAQRSKQTPARGGSVAPIDRPIGRLASDGTRCPSLEPSSCGGFAPFGRRPSRASLACATKNRSRDVSSDRAG